jgi:hypothetical protein
VDADGVYECRWCARAARIQEQAEAIALAGILAAAKPVPAAIAESLSPATQSARSEVINAEEAAQLLGGISLKALYARTARHQVPGRLPGRRVQFLREKFLEGLRKKAR